MLKTYSNVKTRLLLPKVIILIMTAFFSIAPAYFSYSEHKDNETIKIESFLTQTSPKTDTTQKVKSGDSKNEKQATPTKTEASPVKSNVKTSQNPVNTSAGKKNSNSPATGESNKSKKIAEENDENAEKIEDDKETKIDNHSENLPESQLNTANIEKISTLVDKEITDQCKAKGPRCNNAFILKSVLDNFENLGARTQQTFTELCFNRIKDSKNVLAECENEAAVIVLTEFSNLFKKNTELGGEIKGIAAALIGNSFLNLNDYNLLVYTIPVSLALLVATYLLLVYFKVIDWRGRSLKKQSQNNIPTIQPSAYGNHISDEEMNKVLRETGDYQKYDKGQNPIIEGDAQPEKAEFIKEDSSRAARLENLQESEDTSEKKIPERAASNQFPIHDSASQHHSKLFPGLVGNILDKALVKESLVQYPLIKQALKKPSNDSDTSVFSLISEDYKGQLRHCVIPSYIRIGKEMEFSLYKEFFTTDSQFYSGDIVVIEPAEVIWDETIRGWRLQKQGKLRFM